MKSLYESILTGNITKPSALVPARSRAELQQIIADHIKRLKPKPGDEVDFNWIDVSDVDDLSELFMHTDYIPVIDKWDITHVGAFESMFLGNKYIKRSPLPRLQEKLLCNWCYRGMFSDCTSLVEPPELPAKKLTLGCYVGMFWSCTSLEHAPELPAKELAPSCYASMFGNCKKLQTPPDLPATELAHNCYNLMFRDCISLTRMARRPKPKNANVAGSTASMYYGCKHID